MRGSYLEGSQSHKPAGDALKRNNDEEGKRRIGREDGHPSSAERGAGDTHPKRKHKMKKQTKK